MSKLSQIKKVGNLVQRVPIMKIDNLPLKWNYLGIVEPLQGGHMHELLTHDTRLFPLSTEFHAPLPVLLARQSGRYEGITYFPDGFKAPFPIEGKPVPINFMDPGWYGKKVFRFKGFKGGNGQLDLWEYICEIDGTKRPDKPQRKERSHDHQPITMEEQKVPPFPPNLVDAP